MPFDAHLPCYFCRDDGLYVTFPDFGPLAAHVARKHFQDREFLKAGILECLESHPELKNLSEKELYEMNIGSHIENSGSDRLPLLDAKLFGRLKDQKGIVSGKMLACREVKSPKFKGLAMDFRNGSEKFSFLARFDRWDVGNLAKQAKSEETDDWIGQTFKFVAKKGEKGTFVNALNPNSKK